MSRILREHDMHQRWERATFPPIAQCEHPMIDVAWTHRNGLPQVLYFRNARVMKRWCAVNQDACDEADYFRTHP